MEIDQVEAGVYVARAPARLDSAFIDAVLERIWSAPDWGQPWGLIIDVRDAQSYDPDVRKTRVPPKDRRAVGTAVVAEKTMHRLVIRSVGLGLKTLTGFELSAHDELDGAIEHMRSAVATCREQGRDY